jgi:hypothetical protein
LVLLALIAPIAVLRVIMWFTPNSDMMVGTYNVHHLFTGLLLIAAGGIPLALFSGSSRRLDFATVLFGVGLGLALDEWVYLIATDGSNASYLLPVSFWGSVIMIGATTLYALLLTALWNRRVRREYR